MTTVTDFKAHDESKNTVTCDAHGNNVAFLCLTCHGPVLAVIRPHQRGSSKIKPSSCPVCASKFFVTADETNKLLLIQKA